MNIEKEIIEKGLTAPRITPDHIESVIEKEQYHIFEGTTFTSCLLTLRNGFTVHGESACASPENFDEELGRKIARDNAKNKIWALEGYLLKEILSHSTGSFIDRLKAEKMALDDKFEKLSAFLMTDTFGQLEEKDQDLLCEQLSSMQDYSQILSARLNRLNVNE